MKIEQKSLDRLFAERATGKHTSNVLRQGRAVGRLWTLRDTSHPEPQKAVSIDASALKIAKALNEFRSVDPIVWDGINEAYQALVDKSILNSLSIQEAERMEKLGQALDRMMEPYDLARIEAVEAKRRGG